MAGNMSIADFLDAVERHNGKTMRYKSEVGRLLQGAAARSMEQVFGDLVFHATFVVKTRDVMKRIGQGAEGFDTLSAQFSEGVERVSTLIRTLLKDGPEEDKQGFSGLFFTMEREALDRLLDLMSDLALIKHWQVDGKPLPFQREATHSPDRKGTDSMLQHIRNLNRAAGLALLLLIVMVVIDGPFTILGWATAIVIAGLLIAILYEATAARKEAA